MSLTNIEASMFRYLYENLEVAQGVKVFESIYYVDFEAYDRWVVIDSLTNTLDAQPKQLYFIHIAIKKGLQNEKEVLIRLVDLVVSLLKKFTRIDVYDYDSGEVVGEAEICQNALSPILQHPGGGSYRSLTIGLAYAE